MLQQRVDTVVEDYVGIAPIHALNLTRNRASLKQTICKDDDVRQADTVSDMAHAARHSDESTSRCHRLNDRWQRLVPAGPSDGTSRTGP